MRSGCRTPSGRVFTDGNMWLLFLEPMMYRFVSLTASVQAFEFAGNACQPSLDQWHTSQHLNLNVFPNDQTMHLDFVAVRFAPLVSRLFLFAKSAFFLSHAHSFISFPVSRHREITCFFSADFCRNTATLCLDWKAICANLTRCMLSLKPMLSNLLQKYSTSIS